jgi:methylated-DNA-[protein]-cysteine S-methyltransferase
MSATIGSSARAVGTACGRNPIAIIIPCHRVLAAGGKIGGYSGGSGTATKRYLLSLEGVELNE